MSKVKALMLFLFLCNSGCNMFPRWMHPGNLWKLNAQAPPSGESMYFSVPDPVTDDPFLMQSEHDHTDREDFATFGSLDSSGR